MSQSNNSFRGKVDRIITVVALVFAALSCSCDHGDAVDRYRERVHRELPEGTPSSRVEQYFKSHNIPFTYSTLEELALTGTTDSGPEKGILAVLNYSGRYHAAVRLEGRSLRGPSTIWIYVYLDKSGRVVGTRVEGVYPG